MSFSLSNIHIFLGLVVVGLWYYIKYLVHRAGYETHLFWGHGNDIQNLGRLIDKEQNDRKKGQLKALLFAFYASLALAIVSFLVVIIWFR